MKRLQFLHRHLNPSSSSSSSHLPGLAHVHDQEQSRSSNNESGQCYVNGDSYLDKSSVLGTDKHQFASAKGEGFCFKPCMGQSVLQLSVQEKKGMQLVQRKKVCLVIGAGDATGGEVAKRFAKEGFVACIVRRNKDQLLPLQEEIVRAGGEAHAFGVDARKEDQMVGLVEQIENSIGEIKVAIFNIGANVNFGILETTSRVYFKVWEMACFAGFLMGREVTKYMVPRGEGTIVFTGATASVRGGAGFSAFAGAKFALRALAQSMARELGPKGLHVAHVVIDAAINTSWTLQNVKGASELVQQSGMVQPEDVADIYWLIYQQPSSAWTHELDLRPWKEKW